MLAYVAFIIFGRKIREKDYGPSYPLFCQRCQNDVLYHAFKWRSWFHVFWIPLIPWTSHKELVCPICQARYELDRSEFQAARTLVDATQQYTEHRLSDREYAQAVHDFEAAVSFVEEPMTPSEIEEEIDLSAPDDQQLGESPREAQ